MKLLHWLFLLLAACTAAHKGVESGVDSGQRIRIFYNNDNFAFLEPCGCRVSPIGSMARRWNAMVAYPEESRILVDAGNLLFKSNRSSEFLAPQWFEQAAGVIEAYNLLKADAAGIGENEFALGIEKFRELAAKAHFPFLSANIYWKGKNELFARDSLMIERYGKKIGIFSVYLPSLSLPAELEARDPVSTARAMVRKLKSAGAEMIVLLSHQGYDEDEKLAAEVKGIDLLVGAHSQSLLQRPDMVGDTLVVQLSSQGQMLGLVEYNAHSLKREDFVVAELNAEYDNPPRDLANPMKNLVAVTNLRIAEKNKEVQTAALPPPPTDSGQPAFETFLSCRDCHVAQAKFQEGKLHAAAFLTLVGKKQEMNLDCVKCHSVGLDSASGFHSLADAFRDGNGKPIAWDKIRAVMGKNITHPDLSYRDQPAKVAPDVKEWIGALKKAGVKKSFVGVQCENCHGLMPGHPFAGDAPKPLKVATNTCLQCHTPSQMPAWYDPKGKVKTATVAAALKSITCPRK